MSRSKLLGIALLLMQGISCKMSTSSLTTKGVSADSLEHDKKLHELSPEYAQLGVIGADGIRQVRLGVFLNCDPFATTKEHEGKADLCLPDASNDASNYGDQAFRQMLEWIAGYTLSDELKLDPIANAKAFVDVSKMDDLVISDEARTITFSGKGPALDHRKNASLGYDVWNVTINLTSSGVGMLQSLAASMKDYDILYVGGSIYNQENLVNGMVNDEKALAPYLDAISSKNAVGVEKSTYKLMILNSCFTETLEDNLFAEWQTLEDKLSTPVKLDIVGQRGKSNYRHFAQQLARLLSNLHEGNSWVDILKGIKIANETGHGINAALKSALQRHGVALASIPILRNNQELTDRKLDRSMLFDENGARGDE